MARKATARKQKGGYRAVVIRSDGSSFSGSKLYPERNLAIASAQIWLEEIEANSKKFQEGNKPFKWEPTQ